MENIVFIVAVVSIFFSQFLKILINFVKEKKVNFNDLFVTGGMPSTHSSGVSALLTILLLETGFSIFSAIAFVLFIIVTIDAMGVRRTVGDEAKAINKIIKIEKLRLGKIHYSLGHKPNEVIWGIVIGIIIAFSFYFLL